MIAIVTDSTACLTQAEAKSWNVFVVPHEYRLDGNLYTETYDGENGAYASALRRSRERVTLQASEERFFHLFHSLRSRGMEVLCTVLSSRLSGAFSAASTAAQRLGGGVEVVDSHLTAGGLYLLISRLREEIDAQHLGLAAAKRFCEEVRNHIGVAFSVENMDALRRSHRIGVVRQSVSSILNRRPILLLQRGAIISCGLARGWQEKLEKLTAQIPPQASRLVVQYYENKKEAVLLASELKQRLCVPQILLREIGPVLSIHIGEDALAVSWTDGSSAEGGRTQRA